MYIPSYCTCLFSLLCSSSLPECSRDLEAKSQLHYQLSLTVSYLMAILSIYLLWVMNFHWRRVMRYTRRLNFQFEQVSFWLMQTWLRYRHDGQMDGQTNGFSALNACLVCYSYMTSLPVYCSTVTMHNYVSVPIFSFLVTYIDT